MDRFTDLMQRRTPVRIFGPGAIAGAFGNNTTIRSIFGNDFPAVFVPLEVDPPPLGPGTKYEMKEAAFGAHAFISYSATDRGQSWNASIRGVMAFCLLDASIREATLHLLETTRDENGELGGQPARFRMGFARIPEVRGFAHSGPRLPLPRLLDAFRLYPSTDRKERQTLTEALCPLCEAGMMDSAT